LIQVSDYEKGDYVSFCTLEWWVGSITEMILYVTGDLTRFSEIGGNLFAFWVRK